MYLFVFYPGNKKGIKMRKLLCAAVIFISAVNIYSQDFSVQGSGGVIIPMSSSKGLSANAQFNYLYSNNIVFYIGSGYSAWDKYNATFKEELSVVQTREYFTTWLADDHVLIPVNAGCRVNLHTNKIFTSFISVETGYSYLKYYSYQTRKEINPNTGEVTGYFPDSRTKKQESENLFSIGIGAGISHPVTKKVNLILAFKINSCINSHYHGFFSSRGTHTMFQLGVDYSI